MLLSPYAMREWLTLLIGGAIGVGLFGWLGWWWPAAAVAIVCVALLAFFRDPPRPVPDALPAAALLSPADGTVSAIVRLEHHPAVEGPATIVRVFLSIFNVHVNRAPAGGRVIAVQHSAGRHFDARTDRSASENECTLITMETDAGDTIGVRQVAGAVARRIVCALEPGDHVSRGQKFGMIKFGSTAELILPRPEQVQIQVRVGDRVKAGLTPLATLPPLNEG